MTAEVFLDSAGAIDKFLSIVATIVTRLYNLTLARSLSSIG